LPRFSSWHISHWGFGWGWRLGTLANNTLSAVFVNDADESKDIITSDEDDHLWLNFTQKKQWTPTLSVLKSSLQLME